MKRHPFLMGALLAATALLCMAQQTVIKRVRDLFDVRLPAPASIPAADVLTWNGTVWTNAAGGGGGEGAIYITNFSAGTFITNNNLIDLLNYTNGYNGNIRVGTNSVSTEVNGIAIGKAAVAGANAIAFGSSTTATNGTAFGNSASVNGLGTSGFGASSTASATGATALGSTAAGTHSYSTAVGYAAATTVTRQVRLGTSAEHVSMPGNAHVAGTLTNQVNLSPWVELVYTDDTNVVVNCAAGNAFYLTITGETFITITNIPSALWTAQLELRQDADGENVVTFHTNYIAFPSGTQPSVSTDGLARDVVSFMSSSAGTNVNALHNATFQP